MKLSPRKVEDLAERLIDQLMEVDGVMFQADDARLKLALQEVISDELMVEERLDAEIHKTLQQHKSEIVLGRLSYDELFKKAKRDLVAQRRLVL
jgi:hypothetical protein